MQKLGIFVLDTLHGHTNLHLSGKCKIIVRGQLAQSLAQSSPFKLKHLETAQAILTLVSSFKNSFF